jgi:hypothetical protein
VLLSNVREMATVIGEPFRKIEKTEAVRRVAP